MTLYAKFRTSSSNIIYWHAVIKVNFFSRAKNRYLGFVFGLAVLKMHIMLLNSSGRSSVTLNPPVALDPRFGNPWHKDNSIHLYHHYYCSCNALIVRTCAAQTQTQRRNWLKSLEHENNTGALDRHIKGLRDDWGKEKCEQTWTHCQFVLQAVFLVCALSALCAGIIQSMTARTNRPLPDWPQLNSVSQQVHR